MKTTSTTNPHRYGNVKILSPEFADQVRAATGIKDIAFMALVGVNGKMHLLKSNKISTASHENEEKHEMCFEVEIEGMKCRICVMV